MLKQCKPLGQSLDHDALVAINKKLEKEPQTRKTLIFADAKSIHLLSGLEKKKKKTEKDVLIVNDFGTPHLASPISKTSGFQKIRLQTICKYIGRTKYCTIRMRKCFKLDDRNISAALYFVLSYPLLNDRGPYFQRVLSHSRYNITSLYGWAFTLS